MPWLAFPLVVDDTVTGAATEDLAASTQPLIPDGGMLVPGPVPKRLCERDDDTLCLRDDSPLYTLEQS